MRETAILQAPYRQVMDAQPGWNCGHRVVLPIADQQRQNISRGWQHALSGPAWARATPAVLACRRIGLLVTVKG